MTISLLDAGILSGLIATVWLHLYLSAERIVSEARPRRRRRGGQACPGAAPLPSPGRGRGPRRRR